MDYQLIQESIQRARALANRIGIDLEHLFTEREEALRRRHSK